MDRYCDVKMSHTARVESLLAMLTLEEKAGLVSPDPGLGSTCFAHIHAIPRVGLPEYVSFATLFLCCLPLSCIFSADIHPAL